MTAAIFALKIYTKHLFNTSVHLKVDNTATLTWINKQTGPNVPIFLLVKEFWDFCRSKSLWVQASSIKSKRNKTAYKESRTTRENLEWSLVQNIFLKLHDKYGPFSIDLFASRVNRKVDKYCSFYVDHEAFAFDAFSIEWVGELFYAFPTFISSLKYYKR